MILSKLGNSLILKYCRNRTLFNLLKSKSILTHPTLEKIKSLTLTNQYLGIQLYNYCKKNDRIRLAKLIHQNPSIYWNHGFYGACRGGHREIVNLMITKGANTHWSDGLGMACEGGHLELIDLMIEKGAKFCHNCYRTMANH